MKSIRVSRSESKPLPTSRTVVLFDATQRRANSPHFGKGLLSSRWIGQHSRVGYDASDAAWAALAFSHIDVIREARAEMEAQA